MNSLPSRILETAKALWTRMGRFKRERPNAYAARLMAVIILVVSAGWGGWYFTKPTEISLTMLLAEISQKKVISAEVLTQQSGYGIYATIGDDRFYIRAPMTAIDQKEGKDGTNILQALQASGAEITFAAGAMETFGIVMAILSPAIMIVCFIFMGLAMAKDSTTGWMNLVKSVKTRFDDVAGADEAKAELQEVLDYFQGKFNVEGATARTPRGVLLSGPPGTGKTLLAKALAGEAGTSFIAVSGSDLQSMFYGGSSKRVRSLFAHARKNAPCIIFIDEFDAVASKRTDRSDAISRENNTTLNQLLVEMDGFANNDGILVMAATNLVDSLDPAVKRAGRMDRRVEVPLPDVKGRAAILAVHARKHKLAEGVDLDTVARGVPGFSGAELENLINEAAIFAARRGSVEISDSDLESAKNKIIMGLARKTFVMSDEVRRLTAYHEAGHALVATLSSYSDPVHRATIVPHGGALGMVVRLPEGDRVSVTVAKLRDDLKVAMAGRAAEEVAFGQDAVTTGAQADIEFATEYATRMVVDWGFSEKIGMVKVSRERAERDPDVNEEIRAIVAEAYDDARRMIRDNKDRLTAIAEALMDRETLTGDEVRKLTHAQHQEQEAPLIEAKRFRPIAVQP
ncbi:AAA family ATPase [Agrobacterium salinitolerans]|nr:AAA family ATPase [Agrobacterium salinitolerans]